MGVKELIKFFCISTPILWHVIGKVYLPEKQLGLRLEQASALSLTKNDICPTWPVVERSKALPFQTGLK